MYVVGVDCGGTSTKVLVADQSGRIVGRGRGGPANYAVDGYDGVMQRVEQALAQALAQAALSWEDLLGQGAVLAAGVSGTSIPGSAARLERGWREQGFQDVTVSVDALVALMGALSGKDGAIVISGTGSVGYGRWERRHVQVGGWGYILGDEGSSFWITREILRHLLRMRDGTAPRDPELEQVVLEHFQAAAVEEVVRIVYAVPIDRGYLGSLTPVIVRLAEAGHPTCRAVVAAAGRELGLLAAQVVERLDTGGSPCRVAACGGVFAAGDVILEPMRAALAERAPHAQLTMPDFEPAAGALLAGYERLGTVPDNVLPLLAKSLKEMRSDA